jgi:protein TonB
MSALTKYDIVLEDALESRQERSAKYRSFLITLLIFILLFLFALYFAIPPTDPPLTESGGTMDVILGNDAIGMNDVYTGVAAGSSQPVTTETPKPAPSIEQPTPSDIPEPDPDAAVLAKKKIEKVKPTPVDKPVVESKPVITPTPEKEVVKKEPKVEKKVDSRALFSKGPNGNNGTGGPGSSKGTGNTAGDQGSKNGDPNSKSFSGDGSGTGTGGGTGPGNGPGSGIGYDLTGRSKVSIPAIEDNSQETGRIVVEITVNRAGAVIEARSGARGTTIVDDNLLRKAEQYAKKARFSANSDASEKQYGKITYNFRLQ